MWKKLQLIVLNKTKCKRMVNIDKFREQITFSMHILSDAVLEFHTSFGLLVMREFSKIHLVTLKNFNPLLCVVTNN